MAKDASAILVQPGELIWAPTDLSAASPHSGTSLGFTRDGIRLEHNISYKSILTEETGVAPQDVIYLGGALQITATLMQWDDTAIQRIFPNTATGGTSGNKVVEFPGSGVYPGYKLSNAGAVLAYSPTDLTNGEMVLFRKAIALGTREIPMRTAEETVLSVVFIAIPDTSIASGNARYDSRTVAIGDRTDLSIS